MARMLGAELPRSVVKGRMGSFSVRLFLMAHLRINQSLAPKHLDIMANISVASRLPCPDINVTEAPHRARIMSDQAAFQSLWTCLTATIFSVSRM